ncbi:MAG: DUF2851 family protein [Balneola sp.]
MPKTSFPYSENILQWVWNEQLFDIEHLQTECGRRLRILNPGLLNKSDGPDFKHSKILIDNTEWNGSVELHLKSKGWKQHNHHRDSQYNNVILHVVVENDPLMVTTKSQHTPYTLNLLPYLHSDLEKFLSNINSSKFLPCAANLNYISKDVFEQQINKAHHEYLEKKVQDFLHFYTPGISQSLAWKHALIISVFDGFGISKNRQAMQGLAQQLLKYEYSSIQELQDKAYKFAFGKNTVSHWNYKGCRPNAHPAKRIKTATLFMDAILQTPFNNFLEENVFKLWSVWCKKFGVHKAGHPKILFATVFLPALYFLGTLYCSKKLINTVNNEWDSYKAPIPKVLVSKFEQLDISPSVYQKKLGAMHQLNHYCRQKKCSECLVLKKVISS